MTCIVRSHANLGPFEQHPQSNVIRGDLEDDQLVSNTVQEHDILVHAAILWGAPGTEFEMRDTAVAAKLFEAAANSGIKRSIYISSVAVHRPFTPGMHENEGLNATDIYSATKAAGELCLRAACADSEMIGGGSSSRTGNWLASICGGIVSQ